MLITVSIRTDIVQYFSPWLIKRLEAGFVLTRNPLFPNKVTRYELQADKVDAIIFCSKNYQPILAYLPEIMQKFNTYFHYTITAYDHEIEPGVPSIAKSIATLIQLAKIVGKKRIAWRYDPILLTHKYTLDLHQERFEQMAKMLAPYISRCIFSFVQMYKKLAFNMPEIIALTERGKEQIASILGKIAKKYGIYLQSCASDQDFSQYGINQASCISLDLLGAANNVKFRQLKHSGMRENCHCIKSHDLGTYDTCLNACKYCYANKNPQIAFANYKYHDPDSPLLLGHLKPTDIVQNGEQKSFLDKSIPKGQQMLEIAFKNKT